MSDEYRRSEYNGEWVAPGWVDGKETRYWVVLASGELLEDLTGEEYDVAMETGETIDGGEMAS